MVAADDLDSFDVPRVMEAQSLFSRGLLTFNRDHHNREKDRREHRHQKEREAKDFVKTLSRASIYANEELSRNHSPFRFGIEESHGRVVLFLVRVDAAGRAVERVEQDVTHQDFNRLIEDLSAHEGFFIDISA